MSEVVFKLIIVALVFVIDRYLLKSYKWMPSTVPMILHMNQAEKEKYNKQMGLAAFITVSVIFLFLPLEWLLSL